MVIKHPSNKYLILDDVRVSYNPKEDSVHLTSGDPDVQSTGFHINLSPGTRTEIALRNLLIEQGLISPRFSTSTPQWGSKGKIFSFLGRGGTGKTTLTYSLATALSKSGLKVAVVDGDFHDPQLKYLIGENPSKNITTYLQERSPNKTIKNHMTLTKQGWDALLSEGKAKDVDLITESALESVLDELRELYDVILIDSSVNFDSSLNHLLWSHSDYLLWMMHGNPNEQDRYTRLLNKLSVNPNLASIVERIGIVINFTLAETNLDSWQRILDAHIVATVPYYREVPLSAQQENGLTSLLDEKNTYTRAIAQLSGLMKTLV